MNTNIAKFETQPMPQLTIDEQMQVWRDNAPVWANFPAKDQSGVYIFGWGDEHLLPNDPGGAIIVFNARRGTVKAYPNTSRNQKRAMSLFGKFGYIGNRVGAKTAYCDGAPRGVTIPDHDAAMVLDRGIVVWLSGYTTYVNTDYSASEWSYYLAARERLHSCYFTSKVWSYTLEFCPDFANRTLEPMVTVTIDDAPITDQLTVEPTAPRDEELSGFRICNPTPGLSAQIRREMRGLGFDGDSAIIEWRGGLAGYMYYIGQIDEIAHPDDGAPRLAHDGAQFWIIPLQSQPIALSWVEIDTMPDYDEELNPAQVAALYAQLEYYSAEFDSAWDCADLDRCEMVSLHILAIEGILAAL